MLIMQMVTIVCFAHVANEHNNKPMLVMNIPVLMTAAITTATPTIMITQW